MVYYIDAVLYLYEYGSLIGMQSQLPSLIQYTKQIAQRYCFNQSYCFYFMFTWCKTFGMGSHRNQLKHYKKGIFDQFNAPSPLNSLSATSRLNWLFIVFLKPSKTDLIGLPTCCKTPYVLSENRQEPIRSAIGISFFVPFVFLRSLLSSL